MWLCSSVVRVLARYAKGPGFKSRSGHVLLCFFSLLLHLVAQCGSMFGLRAAKGLFVGSGMVPSRFGDKSN